MPNIYKLRCKFKTPWCERKKIPNLIHIQKHFNFKQTYAPNNRITH